MRMQKTAARAGRQDMGTKCTEECFQQDLPSTSVNDEIQAQTISNIFQTLANIVTPPHLLLICPAGWLLAGWLAG